VLLQHAGEHRRGDVAQLDPAGLATAGALDVVLRGLKLAHRQFGLDLQRASRFRQPHLSLFTEKQPGAQRVFQVLDLPRQRGRRDAQLLGGASEMPMTGDGQKIAKVTDFHGALPGR
jgi:hypothetical protein